ncbi:MAG TPA: hypothetical protein VGC39_10305 [Candidatus Methylacidiphilales bacterium]
MKMAKQAYDVCMWGFLGSLWMWQLGARMFPRWFGWEQWYLFLGLTLAFLLGCILTYRKTRGGQLSLIERDRKKGLLTNEECAAKRQEILKDL